MIFCYGEKNGLYGCLPIYSDGDSIGYNQAKLRQSAWHQLTVERYENGLSSTLCTYVELIYCIEKL